MSLASVALFAGCQKNEIKEVSVEENASTFELVADIAQTKTTLDGRVVEWEEGDIIYMVTSDGTWGVPYAIDKSTTSIAEFTYAGGKFSTPATIADGSYTFNAIYSNGDQMSYHRSDKTTNQLSATQNQNCANPTAHIKKYDALVGTIEASVPMNEPAKLTMSHLYTMMQVNIVNNTGADITVSKFEMTVADADLAGVFTVTSFANPAITAKEGEADTETITVNVTGGTVANNASLPVYFVMAPLSNYSGDVTFKVTDSQGKTYTKTIALSGISFEAGKYNTTPYAISEADEVAPEPEGATTVTFDFTSADELDALGIDVPGPGSGTNISGMTLVKNEVTMTSTNGGTSTRVWNNNGKLELRVYKNGGSLTLSVPEGNNITKVAFEGSNLVNFSSQDEKYKSSEWSGSSQTVTFSASGTVNVKTISVTYISGEGETPTIQPRNLAFSATTAAATVGQPFTAPTLSGVTTGVAYTSSNTAVATVNAETGAVTLVGAGTTTIKASAPATAEYEAGEASYTLTVNPAQGGGDPVTVSKQIKDISGKPANGTKVSTMKLDDVISATASESGNNGKVYVDGSEWRLYMTDKGTVTINAKSGYTIKTVKFTYNQSNSGTLLYSSTVIKSGTVHAVNAQNVTFSVGSTTSATNGQVKVTAIEVVYQNN